jgi:hypothetical protein
MHALSHDGETVEEDQTNQLHGNVSGKDPMSRPALMKGPKGNQRQSNIFTLVQQ